MIYTYNSIPTTSLLNKRKCCLATAEWHNSICYWIQAAFCSFLCPQIGTLTSVFPRGAFSTRYEAARFSRGSSTPCKHWIARGVCVKKKKMCAFLYAGNSQGKKECLNIEVFFSFGWPCQVVKPRMRQVTFVRGYFRHSSQSSEFKKASGHVQVFFFFDSPQTVTLFDWSYSQQWSKKK